MNKNERIAFSGLEILDYTVLRYMFAVIHRFLLAIKQRAELATIWQKVSVLSAFSR